MTAKQKIPPAAGQRGPAFPAHRLAARQPFADRFVRAPGLAADDLCRVPADHLIGAEGSGFRAIMENFNGERLMMAVAAAAFAEVCYDEALDWARQLGIS